MPTPDTVYRWLWRFVICAIAGLALGTAAALLPGCTTAPEPTQGGGSTISLGGVEGPTVVTTAAPQNPQTPSITTVEKSTTREFLATEQGAGSTEQNLQVISQEPAERAEHNTPVSVTSPRSPRAPVKPVLVREIVVEKSTTQIGSSWQDTARELGAKLAAMQPVMWVGALLVPIGIGVGWLVAKRGWLINGVILGLAIAGSGAAMVAIAVWLPGINPLCGLLLLGLVFAAGLVWAVYYKSQHDALAEGKTLKAES